MRRSGELGPALMPMQPHAGRAEALRRAQLAYMNDTTIALNAYPVLWRRS